MTQEQLALVFLAMAYGCILFRRSMWIVIFLAAALIVWLGV